MTTLLRIDSSMRTSGSISRRVADRVQAAWLRSRAAGRVLVRDLATETPPHLDQHTYESFRSPESSVSVPSYSARAIAELRRATDLLITCPIYNFGPPSTLKAWFDHVVRSGVTFEETEGVYRPLLRGGRAVLVISRGGTDDADSAECVRQLVQTTLRFIGWQHLQVIDVAGTGTAEAEQRIDAALQTADTVFRDLGPCADRDAIDSLRAAQSEAITRGDAEAYAALCTEDVHLLIPGQPPVMGRDAFLTREREVFARGRFHGFEKTPIETSVCGDVAYEVGLQQVDSTGTAKAGVYVASQKYCHVFRRTRDGWRFAVLMSNGAE